MTFKVGDRVSHTTSGFNGTVAVVDYRGYGNILVQCDGPYLAPNRHEYLKEGIDNGYNAGITYLRPEPPNDMTDGLKMYDSIIKSQEM